MSSYASPGVYTTERDLSSYVSDLSATIVGMVGTSPKGPTNVLTYVTTPSSFVNIFGDVDPDHYLGYSAISYLKKGRSLWVLRVAPADATKAAVTFPVPLSYTPYAGEWELNGSDATSITFRCKDFSTVASDAACVVELPATTPLPFFNLMDSTGGTGNANGELGSDLLSFVTLAKTSFIKGNKLSITLGAGNGYSGTITDLTGSATSVGDDTTGVHIKISSANIPSSLSPVNATATGSIYMSVPADSWTMSDATTLMILGNATDGGLLKLKYDKSIAANDGQRDALLAALTNATKATRFAALETLVVANSTGTPDTYAIAWSIYDPWVAGNNSKSLELLNAILTVLLEAVNIASGADQLADLPVGTYPNLFYFWTNSKVLVPGSAAYAVGSLSTTYRGFASVELISSSATTYSGLRLYAVTPGATGIYKYSYQSPVPSAVASTPLVVSDMNISGQFTTTAARPAWVMTASGASYIPTFMKFTTVGESDFSDTAVTVSMNPLNVLNTEQQYVVSIYKRLSSPTISATSEHIADFGLVEQFEGSPDILMSRINASSRNVSLKLDYTTADTVSYTTGAVTNVADGDNLVVSLVPVIENNTNVGAVFGNDFDLLSAYYDKSFNSFLLNGSAGGTVTKNDIIGDAAHGTGLYAFANPELLDVNVLAAPGWSSDPAVAHAMTAICENRGDAMCIIDPPFGLDVQGVVNYRRNILNINSSYAAFYYPWIKINDAVNKRDVFVPPSGAVAAQYAYNDFVGDVYFAPAGTARGSITEALATERILTLGDRDLLYTNSINPIATEAGTGIYIKGQKTLQILTSALDRVNVRRLMLKLRKVIATAAKALEFEPGDLITALRLKQLITSVLEDHKRKGALIDFSVDVGPNVNTDLVRENNELKAEIRIVPAKTAEVIVLGFTILGQNRGVLIQD